ncbi:CBS domain-containing protein, partial [Chamaesiphon sp. GL140_3_metabinner_50]|uniref:CBS domain-containing protein n=1 Tax=Chamaesiphon sp. GL140_3_metabinner_50 TaxID=2970812 RepID=UPI0025DA1E0B
MLDSVSFLSKSEPSDAIFRSPIVVTPDTSAIAAIALMNDIDVAGLSSTAASQLVRLQIQACASCVAIVDREHYIGLLTAGDVVRLCARGQDLDKLPIGNAIGATSVTLKLADFTDLSIAIDLIQRYFLSHLAVVDDRDRLVGIVTSELLQYRVAEALAAQLEQSEAEKAELLENGTLDIQESETELKRLSERLSLSLKSAAVGCWEWDIVNDALIWDDRTYELFGIDRTLFNTENILTYSNWGACLHPEDRQAAEAKIGQVLFCETEFELEYRVIHPDG